MAELASLSGFVMCETHVCDMPPALTEFPVGPPTIEDMPKTRRCEAAAAGLGPYGRPACTVHRAQPPIDEP